MPRNLPRSRRCRTLLLAAAVAGTSIPALAAERRIELVPTLGFRGGASLSPDAGGMSPAEADPSASFGLTVDVDVRPDAWFEAYFERQTLEFTSDSAAFGDSHFDMTVDYLHVGACYGPVREKVRPYVAVAVGFTHFGASGGSVTSSIGMSGSIGGGFQVPIGHRLSFRLEARGYATISDSALAVACGPGCVVRFAGSGWFQLAARAGLAIRL